MKKNINYFNNKKAIIAISCMLLGLFILIAYCITIGNKVTLTCDEAEEIAFKKLGKGIITECERKGRKYEIEIISDNLEYEFIVDGNTGEIISYDSDDFDD